MAEQDKLTKTPKKKSPMHKLIGFLSGYKLAAIVFFLTLILTLLGTLEQENKGIHEVQEKYFTSFMVIHDFGPIRFGDRDIPIKLPIPGGYLLMAVLFVNLLLGGIIRIRKDWRRAPLVLTHFSILLLLAGAWVTHHFADDGNMRVFEGGQSNFFSSYVIWDISVERWEGGKPPETALVIQEENLRPIKGDSRRVFHNDSLPFDIEISNYMMNSMPAFRRASALDETAAQKSFDGFYLVEKDRYKEAERNIPGAELRVLGKDGKVISEGLVWGIARSPLVVDLDGAKWIFRYEKRIYDVPFTIALDDFVEEKHPGTSMSKRFVSTVRKLEDESEEKIVIKMNHPLRHRGYTLFQAGFGPSENDPPGTGVYSVFAVWRNPSDQWPLYACALVGIGMLGHFVLKLVLFLVRTAKTIQRDESLNEKSAPKNS